MLFKDMNRKLVKNLSQDHLDVKTFWKLSKNILSCKSDRSIPPLNGYSQIIPDDLSKATILITILHLCRPSPKM